MTAPVEVITTTITSWGWSSSTSTWRTVDDSGGGARHHAEQVGHLGDHVGQAAKRRVDLAPHLGQVEAVSTMPAAATGGSRVSSVST